ncbi:MAG: DUF2135 domain-containing protein, partial [Calditrichia bacterium]|nr:DUF2135 domain-containing protein [Calditrichia bacterium]
SGMSKRIWAQKKISQLDMMFEKNEKEITALGKQFSIVTRNTSLIVLDRLEDYVQHRIVPPEEMQNEYFAMIEKEEEERERTEKEHLEEVVQKFKEQIAWWEREFPMDKPKLDKKMKKTMSVSGGRSDDVMYSISGVAAEADDEVVAEMAVPAARMAPMGKAEEAESEEAGQESSISLSKWDPKTPYLEKISKKKKGEWYSTYLTLKKDYANSSAFFLDMADFFMEKKQNETALRVLSNIAEMELENHQLMRILGHRLKQLGFYKLAISVFEEVLKIREEEPQSYRDLGLVFSLNKQFQNAIDMLYTVVKRQWDDRFPNIELIALHEMNAVIATCKDQLNLRKIDKRLLKNLDVDIRVVLNWDADNCDMDLWVIDPNEEKCDYSHQRTYVGGRMSDDFTQGYGPEEFMLRKAKPGKYFIKVNYYGNTQQVLAGATTIQIMLITNFGRDNEKQKAITMRLKDEQEVIDVGEFEFIDGK